MCVPLKIILWGEKKLGEQDWHIHTAMCKMDSWWEAAAQHRQLSSTLCDDAEGWEGGGGRLEREKMHIHRQLIHIIVQQKLTQHFQATVFQFNFF